EGHVQRGEDQDGAVDDADLRHWPALAQNRGRGREGEDNCRRDDSEDDATRSAHANLHLTPSRIRCCRGTMPALRSTNVSSVTRISTTGYSGLRKCRLKSGAARCSASRAHTSSAGVARRDVPRAWSHASAL